MSHDPYSAPETRLFAARLRKWVIAIAILWVIAALLLRAYAPNDPVERASELDHFYYGSIGSDLSAGLPAKLLAILPEMFPEHLPDGAPHDLTAFGFIQEPDEPLPIGFSLRRQYIDRTQINCAVCHTGTVRSEAGAEPIVVPAMPAVTVDLMAFFRFLFDVAADDRFTSETVLAELDARGERDWLDAIVYRFGVPMMKEALLARERRNAFLFAESYTPFGPGRVNTFDTFKIDQFRHFYRAAEETPAREEMLGIVDFPSVWNQAPRDGLWLHWDGNQASVRERNFSAAIGAGTLPQHMDLDGLFRVEAWLSTLPAPGYPFEIDRDLAGRGAAIYAAECAGCHDFGAPLVGTVIPLEEIGTDPHRLWSYTDTVRRAQINFTDGYHWQFRGFRVSDGYAAQPLDGVWARAPYLHNGSVPSMWDLLQPPSERPVAFEVGTDIYDQRRMGFDGRRIAPDRIAAAAFPLLDTRLPGNAASGHTYGTHLPEADKWALIEYIKTL